jgi:hypothetical protein
MTIRVLRDDRAVDWQVWAVRSWASRDRRANPFGEARPALAPQLADGWLTFQSTAGERRRIVPIPEGWDTLDDDALRRLLATAAPVPPSHRRLVE